MNTCLYGQAFLQICWSKGLPFTLFSLLGCVFLFIWLLINYFVYFKFRNTIYLIKDLTQIPVIDCAGVLEVRLII